MHEFIAASGIVSASLEAAGPATGRIARVYVGLGPHAHLDPAILSEAFAMAAAGTEAAGATLRVEMQPDAVAGAITVTGIDVTEEGVSEEPGEPAAP